MNIYHNLLTGRIELRDLTKSKYRALSPKYKARLRRFYTYSYLKDMFISNATKYHINALWAVDGLYHTLIVYKPNLKKSKQINKRFRELTIRCKQISKQLRKESDLI